MRALAEFIMRGRLQSGTVAILGYFIPLLTPSAVALVTMRKGALEGTLVLLIGLLPALISIAIGNSGSLVVWGTLLSLLVVYVPSIVLRLSRSLPLTIGSALVASIVIVFLMVLFASETVADLVELFRSQLAAANIDLSKDEYSTLSQMISVTGVAGMIAYGLALNSIVGVLLGRWLQALAFNPGGFRAEFCELRLGYVVSVVCFLGSVFFYFLGGEYQWWSSLLAIPLLLVALSVAHGVVKAKALSFWWLLLSYFMVFFSMPLVMFVGFLDAWVNFRDRVQKKA